MKNFKSEQEFQDQFRQAANAFVIENELPPIPMARLIELAMAMGGRIALRQIIEDQEVIDSMDEEIDKEIDRMSEELAEEIVSHLTGGQTPNR